MRAEDAKRLIADESLKEAFDLLRQNCNKEFENTRPADVNKLIELSNKLNGIRGFYLELQKILDEESMKETKS